MRDLTVFVVDDEPLVREVVVNFLSCLGLQRERIKDYSCPVALVERLGSEIPDILITDIMMPRISGYQVIEKAIESGVPLVLAISGSHHPISLGHRGRTFITFQPKAFTRDQFTATLLRGIKQANLMN